MRRDEAKKSILSWEEDCREKNRLKFNQFKWLIDFLQHFFEIFKEVSKDTKEKLFDL